MRDIQIKLLFTTIYPFYFIESWSLQCYIVIELSHCSFEFEINVLARYF